MKRILFVVDENKMGGVSILLEDMLNMINLEKKQIDILVLHNSGDRLKNIPKEVGIIYGTKYFKTIDMTIKEVFKTKNIRTILNKLILIFDMKTGFIKYKINRERKKILKSNYDIEIAFKDGFTALFTAFGNSKKKLHWIHYNYGSFNPNAKYKKLFKKILPSFDNIISVSDGVKTDFNAIYELGAKVNVIPNLVNINKIKEKAKQGENVKNKNIEIVSVGRLHPIKGYDRFIDAVSRLNNESLLDNINIKIYGEGPEQNKLEEMIKNFKLDNIVNLRGQVDNPYSHMKNADLFVLPSIFESFGLVIVESLTLGVPVLATEMKITRKLINDGGNGIIVENSSQGLYEGLKTLLNDKKKIIKLKNSAKKYDYNSENKIILNQLDELLK